MDARPIDVSSFSLSTDAAAQRILLPEFDDAGALTYFADAFVVSDTNAAFARMHREYEVEPLPDGSLVLTRIQPADAPVAPAMVARIRLDDNCRELEWEVVEPVIPQDIGGRDDG